MVLSLEFNVINKSELLLSHCSHTPQQLMGVSNHGHLKKLLTSLSTLWGLHI